MTFLFVLLLFAGKWAGTYSGAPVARSKPELRKLVPWTLLPQGGIVIGLGLTMKNEPGFENISDIVIGVVIISSILFEILGSVTTKYALKKAGETGKAGQ